MMTRTKTVITKRLEKRILDVDPDAAFLSADDIATMSEETAHRFLGGDALSPPADFYIEESLRRADEDSFDAKDEDPAASTIIDWPAPQTNEFIAHRDIEDDVWRALRRDRCVVIKGARGSGKSTLWRALMKPSAAFRSGFDISVTVDCFSLRSRSRRLVEQDALYAQFTDEEALQAFLKGVAKDDNPLKAFLNAKFAIGERGARLQGLVVLDHVECLASAAEIAKWLAAFIDRLIEDGVCVLLLHSGTPAPSHEPILNRCAQVILEPLTRSELTAWWARKRFKAFRELGLSADDLMRVTGGSPRLIRDFGRYIVCRKEKASSNDTLICQFETRVQQAFSPEVSRLLSEAIEHPAVLENPCAPVREATQKAFIATGAVVKTRDSLRFLAPLFERKYALLSNGQGLAAVLMNGPDARLATIMKRHSVLGRQLAMNLMQDVQPARVWRRLARTFEILGINNVEFFIRDQGNAKLWFLVYASANGDQRHYWKTRPLYAEEQPDVTLAVKTGRIVQRTGNDITLPFIGEGGRVSVYLKGAIQSKDVDDFEKRLEQRFLWHVALALQPAVALAAERALMRRSEKHWRSVAYRTLDTRPDHLDHELRAALLQASCNAVIVLQRGNFGWEVINALSTEEEADPIVWRQGFGGAYVYQLDQIANHPSGRGLVLEEGDLVEIFPRLQQSDTISAFMCPQPSGRRRSERLIVFAFEGEEAGEMVGDRQMYLSMIAWQANYAS